MLNVEKTYIDKYNIYFSAIHEDITVDELASINELKI